MSPPPSKPGRNDPCPCGSGKKFKACHGARGEAPRAPQAPADSGLGAPLERALRWVRRGDVPRLSAALERVGRLLGAWGPQPGLRLEPGRFDALVQAALERADASAPAEEVRRALAREVLGELGTPAFLEGVRGALLERAKGRAREEAEALCVGALLAVPPRAGTGPETHPVLDLVFDVQLREWSGRHRALAERLEQLAGPLEDRTLSPEANAALARAREGDFGALVAHVEQDPALAARIAAEAKERAARVEAALRSPTAPAVLVPDEDVWLTVALWHPLQRLKAAGTEPQARREAVQALVRAAKEAADEPFLARLLTRLRTRAGEPGRDEASRAFYSDAAVAFEAEPARLLLALVLTGRREPETRDAEELVLLADLQARAAWTPEDLEPLRAHYAARGLDAARERVTRAQERLRAQPLTLA